MQQRIAQVSQKRNNRANTQIRPKIEKSKESSLTKSHDAHLLENISCRIGDTTDRIVPPAE